MSDDYFRQYGLIAIFTALAIAVPTGMLVVSWAASVLKIRPRKPDPVKLSIYECGFETLSGTWNLFNFRFYTLALIFVIFDIEVIFIYPWAVAFKQMGLFAFIEMTVFLAILAFGLVYAWKKNVLEWK